ncbi:MAG: hypothetical protein ACRYGC_15355 [Janthinobacterium lividum]
MAAGREIREMSGGRVAIVCVVGVALAWLAIRFLQGWVERRFGLGAVSAGMVAMAASWVPLVVAVQLSGWGQPVVGEDARRRAAERAIARDRKGRAWVVLLLGFVLVLMVGLMLGEVAGGEWVGGGAIDPIILGTVSISSVHGMLPSPGEPAGEADARDQALRREAVRLGYVVMLGLGVAAAAASERWPVAGAQCWGPVLVAGLLVANVRLMVSPRSAVAEATGVG